MFEQIDFAAPDAIFGLTEAFQRDPNTRKIDLTAGVYRDSSGQTPVLRCVKEAERQLLESEDTKNYLSIAGTEQFAAAVQRLLFGADLNTLGRTATLQCPGGTGALRIAAEVIKRKLPQACVWCSRPTWPNHYQVFEAAGLQVKEYPYVNINGTELDFEGMLESLNLIPPGDIVCLQACCHNPTGFDPSLEHWGAIADVIESRSLLPLVDIAYQGFGDGLEEDARGLRMLCRPDVELLISYSFSKNFGLYSERVGALSIVASLPDAARAAFSHAKCCARAAYSNPPRHGGSVVTTVFANDELEHQWREELSQMRERIVKMRILFVETMRQKGHDFSFLTQQRGLFAYTGLTPMQVDELRTKHSIYIVGGGRINVAGITEDNVDLLCDAIAVILST